MAQGPRSIAVTTDLGTDVLELRSFSGSEEMSRLFHFHLEMVCPEGEVKQNDVITKLVGKKVGIRLNLTEGERHFHGHFSRIAADYGEDGGTVYRAEMVPWLWFLTQTSDCRIFQNKDIKEILQIVFGDSDFSGDVDLKLTGSYPKWEYCVQYRETDFNFVSRLMEQVGIFYYFEHSQGQHKLVITDGTSGYAQLPGPPVDLPFARQAGEDVNDHLTDWQREFEFVSGKWAQTDYDFKKPKSNLAVNEETNLKHPDAKKYEIYDYPGEYVETKVGKNEVKVRMEEEEAPHDRVSATSSCRVFSAGGVFTVGKDHPSKDAQNQQFLITSIRHQASDDSYVGGSGGASYSNSFQCIPAKVTFRPARATPKPLVSGIQTAVVTGPKGEEIYTDKYGRVKVQFHWDREVDNPKMAGNDKKKRERDQSSCWIRCAQNSAGKKWGFMSIPRIGQEVVIDFLEGDPDRPLIVGSVYNEDQLPHYDPEKPEHKTKTYFKTNSSKGGEGFNELMFDDAADKEQVFIHAQKDMDIRVKNHYKEHVTGNRHHIIDGEEGEGNGDDGGNYWETIGHDRHSNVKRHRIDHVEGNVQYMIGNGDVEGGILDTVIEKQEKRKVGKDGQHLEVEGDVNEEIGGNLSLKVKDHDEKAANYALQTDQDIHIMAGMNLVLEAGMTLSLKVGGSFITLTPASVDIKGAPLVQVNTGGAAGNGKGAQPKPPDSVDQAEMKETEEARKEKTGVKSAPD